MKNIIFSLTLACLGPSTNGSSTFPPEKGPLEKVLVDYIGNLNLPDKHHQAQTMKVEFIITRKQEILVTSVDNVFFENTIKSKLNYRTISPQLAHPNKTYILPVTVRHQTLRR